MAKKEKIINNKYLKVCLTIVLILEILFILAFVAYTVLQYRLNTKVTDYGLGRPKKDEVKTGKILEEQPVSSYSKDETLSLIRQTNKELSFSDVKYPVSKQVIRYTTSDGSNDSVAVYARVYKPAAGFAGKSPIFAFAPGTTGIGDQCAASLEQPAKKNWANYDSLLAAYAAQGFTVVATDYEGMRDPDRLHHYMVGELEGRAVLDSVRALNNLNNTKNFVDTKRITLSGYSQGGHSAFWADKIASIYAPELSLKGIVGFGPVDDVEKTLADITRGANINWFGPYILVSYQDYYKVSYPINDILLPRWQASLTNDVLSNCVDSVQAHWGKNPDAVYTKQFLDSIKDSSIFGINYPQLANDMRKNIAGDQNSKSAKLINQGAIDNVVLPDQQRQMITRLCSNGNKSVNYHLYQNTTHYDTMIRSFRDTINWLNSAYNNTLSQQSSECK
jgi:pimeloyl-ACP methyl ester carboxylesterase